MPEEVSGTTVRTFDSVSSEVLASVSQVLGGHLIFELTSMKSHSATLDYRASSLAGGTAPGIVCVCAVCVCVCVCATPKFCVVIVDLLLSFTVSTCLKTP